MVTICRQVWRLGVVSKTVKISVQGLGTRQLMCGRIPVRQELQRHSSCHSIVKHSYCTHKAKTPLHRSTGSEEVELQSSPEEFTLIYRFPQIVLFRAISRAKLYQTIFTVGLVPVIGYNFMTGLMPSTSLIISAGIATFAGAMLYVISQFIRKAIGLISISSDSKVVRVSHLTFWGKRHDIYVDVNNIVPISDLADQPNDVYVAFRRYDTDQILYITLKFGLILDSEKLLKVLGCNADKT